jgi:uncharacterized protein (TIGR00645 family)
MIERLLERFLFSSRWLLAPFYVGLVVSLLLLVVKAMQELGHFVMRIGTAKEGDVILGALTLVDLTLTGSLIVIVIFSGYENFVSRIDAAQHEDWPEWMGKIDFTGLKLKLMSSIVAISAIQLLKAFNEHRQHVGPRSHLARCDPPRLRRLGAGARPVGPHFGQARRALSYLATRTFRHSSGSCAMVIGGRGFAGFGFSRSGANHQSSSAPQPSPAGTGS